jgi:hypothetical protein
MGWRNKTGTGSPEDAKVAAILAKWEEQRTPKNRHQTQLLAAVIDFIDRQYHPGETERLACLEAARRVIGVTLGHWESPEAVAGAGNRHDFVRRAAQESFRAMPTIGMKLGISMKGIHDSEMLQGQYPRDVEVRDGATHLTPGREMDVYMGQHEHLHTGMADAVVKALQKMSRDKDFDLRALRREFPVPKGRAHGEPQS